VDRRWRSARRQGRGTGSHPILAAKELGSILDPLTPPDSTPGQHERVAGRSHRVRPKPCIANRSAWTSPGENLQCCLRAPGPGSSELHDRAVDGRKEITELQISLTGAHEPTGQGHMSPRVVPLPVQFAARDGSLYHISVVPEVLPEPTGTTAGGAGAGPLETAEEAVMLVSRNP
jgi:hypothetical protein